LEKIKRRMGIRRPGSEYVAPGENDVFMNSLTTGDFLRGRERKRERER
jgi:hypothetical protein